MPQKKSSIAGALSFDSQAESVTKNTATEKVSTACVVIPTYNEAQNILDVLDAFFDQARLINRNANGDAIAVQVLVVDDSSPDGTAFVVERYARKNSSVHLLLRPGKGGLGSAYIAGMRHAIDAINPDVIVEMDADLSHNPRDAFRLIMGIREGADFAIGSRYVDGGRLPDNWGLHRRVISTLSNLTTKLILGLWSVKDCTGGFRAIRTSILKKIDLAGLNVRGYAFQAVILDAAIRNGASVVEIPITFSERNAGKSKMGLIDLVEGGLVLLKARLGRASGRRLPVAPGIFAKRELGSGGNNDA